MIHHKAGVEDGVGPRGGCEADSDAGLGGETLGEPGQGRERQHRVQGLGVRRAEEDARRVDGKEQGGFVS